MDKSLGDNHRLQDCPGRRLSVEGSKETGCGFFVPNMLFFVPVALPFPEWCFLFPPVGLKCYRFPALRFLCPAVFSVPVQVFSAPAVLAVKKTEVEWCFRFPHGSGEFV